jgi:O-antigen ligase
MTSGDFGFAPSAPAVSPPSAPAAARPATYKRRSRAIATAVSSLGTSVRAELPMLFWLPLALFTIVIVARVHEVVSPLAALHPGKASAILMLLAGVATLRSSHLKPVLRSTAGKSLCAVCILTLISMPLGLWPSRSLAFVESNLVQIFVLFTFTAVGFSRRATARRLVITLVASVGLAAAYMARSGPQMIGRAYIGSTYDPNVSAALFVCTIPFAVLLLMQQRGSVRWLGLIVAPLLVVGVARTGSRGGLLGLVAVGIWLMYGAPSRAWRRGYLIFATLSICVFLFASTSALNSRFSTILAPEDDYNSYEQGGRLEIWSRGIVYIYTHPVFGVGVTNFEIAEETLGLKTNIGFGISQSAAHNMFIEIGAELGVGGLLALIIAFFATVKTAVQLRQRALSANAQRASPAAIDLY